MGRRKLHVGKPPLSDRPSAQYAMMKLQSIVPDVHFHLVSDCASAKYRGTPYIGSGGKGLQGRIRENAFPEQPVDAAGQADQTSIGQGGH